MKYDITLKVLSPIAIRPTTTSLIRDLNYFIIGNKLYIIDENKLYDLIVEENLQSELTRKTENALEQNTNEILISWLKQKIGRAEIIQKISKVEYTIEDAVKNSNKRELYLTIEDPYNVKYIPGSSLKGAIRTAILYKQAKENYNSVIAFLNKKIKKCYSIRNNYWELRKFSSKLNDQLQNYLLRGEYTAEDGRKKIDPHSDLLRFLQITDSTGIPKSNINVTLIYVAEPKIERNRGTRQLLLQEVIAPDTETKLRLVINDDFLELIDTKLSLKDKKGLLYNIKENLREFYGEVIRAEKEYWIQNKRVKDANFIAFADKLIEFYNFLEDKMNDTNFVPVRIGWGCGWLSTTVGLLIRKNQNLLQTIRRCFKLGKKGLPFPISRRVTYDFYPLGWAQILFS